MTRRASRARRALLLASVLACGRAEAQATPCVVSALDSALAWSAPLDRVVTLHSSGGSLRTALDLVAARAGVRLSYSSGSLPLDREACVPRGALPLGTMLTALLQDAAVTPVSSGGAQVVLAPTRAGGVMPVAARTATLDRVVVTGVRRVPRSAACPTRSTWCRVASCAVLPRRHLAPHSMARSRASGSGPMRRPRCSRASAACVARVRSA